jgi:hypothetical protein
MLILRDIIKDVLKIDVMKKGRKRDIVDARRIYAKILKDKGYTLVEIGESIGREHTIVVHYIKTANAFMSIDYLWAEKYVRCREKFMDGSIVIPKKASQEDLKKSVLKLTKDNEFFIREREKYMNVIDKFIRFDSILQMLHERVPAGKERQIKNKIFRMLNE